MAETMEERLDRLERANSELRQALGRLKRVWAGVLALLVLGVWLGVLSGWLVPSHLRVKHVLAENVSAGSFTVLDGYRSVGSLSAVNGSGFLTLHGPGKGHASLMEGKLSVASEGLGKSIELSALDGQSADAFLSVRQGDQFSTFTFDDKGQPLLLMRQREGKVVQLPQ